MDFSSSEPWSGLPFSASGDLPTPGIEPTSLALPTLAKWILFHYYLKFKFDWAFCVLSGSSTGMEEKTTWKLDTP